MIQACSGNIQKRSGFTIVELLIVIVVIAILATISIVAYSGIQTRAKSSKAQANAAQVQKIAEVYYADFSVYPGTTASFSSGAAKLPAGLGLLTSTALSSTNGENNIDYDYVGASASAATGARIRYWDFGAGTVSTDIIYLGNATSGSTFVNL